MEGRKMAAPQNAITLFKEAETEWVDDPDNNEARQMLSLGVSCSCGFKGKAGDLLCDPDDDTVNNFWCPACKGKGWQWT